MVSAVVVSVQGERPGRDRWGLAIGEFERFLERSGRPQSVVTRIPKRLRRFAAEAGSSPWDVRAETISGWLDGLGCSAPVLYAHRTALRLFYRWAIQEGRTEVDPTAAIGGRLVKNSPPPGWVQPIGDFGRFLKAAGRPRTTVAARTDQLVHCARTVGVASPWDVTADDLVDWLGTRGWARETVRARRSALRTFYAWGITVGHTDQNPALALPSVRPLPPAPRPAPDSLVREAIASAPPRERLMLRLAAEAGLRRAEVAGVHADGIRLEAGTWWLQVCGKGELVRRIPLAPELAHELLERAAGGYVFPGNCDGHLSPRHVGKLLAQLLPGDLTAHTLRHRFATATYAIDNDILGVQQLLGHASPATTQRYVAVPSDNLRRLVAGAAL